jgi:hypothetical protein
MTAGPDDRRGPRLHLGSRAQIQLSRDFTDGCRTRDLRGNAYDVLVRFFPCRVYTNLNHRDTLGYE